MERGPEFRIIGGASQEKKEEIRQELTQALFNHFESLSPEQQEALEKIEYPKSEKDQALIDFANEETNHLMQEAGLEPYSIPAENYHLLPEEEFRKATDTKGSVATTSYRRQGIFLKAPSLRTNPIHFGETILHETLHLKGHIAAEVEGRGDEVQKSLFRAGVSAYSAQGRPQHEHFNGLNEAIVSYETKKLFPSLLSLPILSEERAWLAREEAVERRRKIAEEEHIPEDEIFWVGKTDEDWETFSYRLHRQVLEYVSREIQDEFPDRYQSHDEVFREFLKAQFTGRLLPTARLMEGTFGKGSFRVLGNMTQDRESAVLHLETLQKLRAQKLKLKDAIS